MKYKFAHLYLQHFLSITTLLLLYTMASEYPSSSTSNSQSFNAKRRRIQDSSSEGSDLEILPLSAVNYSAERYRIGIPALPLLPLEELPLPFNSPIIAKFKEFEPRISQILRDNNIDFKEHLTRAVYRTVPGDVSLPGDATIVIHASWIDDTKAQSWYSAAHKIKELLITSARTRNLKVEIVSWQLTDLRVVGAVEASHPLVEAWPIVNSRIHEIIGGFPRLNLGWKSIDALRIGYHSDEAISALVTISITVDYTLNRRDWFRAEALIKRMIDEIDHYDLTDVQVQIERGEVDCTMAFPLIRPDRDGEPHDIIKGGYSDRVSMGSSFGPDRYFRLDPNGPVIMGPTATIGGYLEIRFKKGAWKKYAITNYHCVRQAIDGYTFGRDTQGKSIEGPVRNSSELKKVDRGGNGPNRKEREQATFESPSRRKHRFTVQWHDQQIARFQEALKESPNRATTLQQEIMTQREMKARKIAYFDQGKHLLGCLLMSSGYRQRMKNSRIDLAILEVRDTKMGDNTIPEANAWQDPFSAPIARGEILQGVASCKTDAALGSVFKFGSRTGGTTGKFSHIKSDVKMPWDREPHVNMGYSTEYVFVADPQTPLRPFLDHGDSGSFVFTDSGKWLGLAFGDCHKNNQIGGAVTYLTDAQLVLDWIATRSEGYEVRLPQH